MFYGNKTYTQTHVGIYGDGEFGPSNYLAEPLYNEIYMKEQEVSATFANLITSWKTIAKGSNNELRVRVPQNIMLSQFAHYGLSKPPQKVYGGTENLLKMGKQLPTTVPRGLLNKLVLSEGSSGNSSSRTSSTKMYKASGVVPIGKWQTFTEESILFDSPYDLQKEIEADAKLISMATSAYYADTLYYTAGIRINLTNEDHPFSSMQSPVLGRTIESTIHTMQAFGASKMNAMTRSFSDYGTVPISTSMILIVPAEASMAIADNPDFVKPEKYSNNTIDDREIGILGTARVLAYDNMPLREANNKLIADMYIIAHDPLTGLKLEGHNAPQGVLEMPKMGKEGDVLGRKGVFGIKSWVGAVNTSPERTALISVYINDTSMDIIGAYKAMPDECKDPCTVPCVEDYVAPDRACGTEAGKGNDYVTQGHAPSATKNNGGTHGRERMATTESAGGEDAKHDVTYPEELSTPTGEISGAEANKAKVKALQTIYGDSLISRKEFAEKYPDLDMSEYIAK